MDCTALLLLAEKLAEKFGFDCEFVGEEQFVSEDNGKTWEAE
jgi:hypothetical protein